MTQYLSLINDIYTTIKDNNLDPIAKSKTIIGKIQSNVNKTTTDDLATSCSRFTNKIIGFLCKLDKNKSKLCNLPGAITFVIKQDKINAVIDFITTNKAFVYTLLQSLNTDNEKTELRQMIDDSFIGQQNVSSACISNIQTFLKNLKAGLDAQTNLKAGLDAQTNLKAGLDTQTNLSKVEAVEEDPDYYKERNADLTKEDLVGFRSDTNYNPELKDKYGLVPILGGVKTRRKRKRKMARGSKRRKTKRGKK
jgi:hypothetical protein